MSWKGYVESLMKTNLLNHTAIIGSNDGKIYASSEGFTMTVHNGSLTNEKGEKKEFLVDEYHILLDLFSKKGMVPNPPGIWINNQRYHLVQFNDDVNSVYLKCQNGGACVVKTAKTIVVGTFRNDDDAQKTGGACNSIIEDFAEQLVKANY